MDISEHWSCSTSTSSTVELHGGQLVLVLDLNLPNVVICRCSVFSSYFCSYVAVATIIAAVVMVVVLLGLRYLFNLFGEGCCIYPPSFKAVSYPYQ